jgi:hypothetical protein
VAKAGRLAVSLAPLDSVQKLQQALHAKAKGSPAYRFYALYDKVYRKDVLWSAYQQCRANGGAAGADRETFEDIEQYGVMKWLGELEEELRSRRCWRISICDGSWRVGRYWGTSGLCRLASSTTRMTS